ncbi:hypothetical protein A1O7_04787 [Cladophialophora yegresii CBS 114405]|uniref:EthD domain-containing protein n=1 Tax=Cladophialophora yegresii CBS 114405 TaxID=1182544 RepID=W9WQH1_9EURO|nr:uncharacterized protein A1O7_04787 [Cladophialophora yegresii CBS 114405]EXJ60634.1 hypothetical protein A1O7_04787 [Cladophialophora yegresii CBS 114405]
MSSQPSTPSRSLLRGSAILIIWGRQSNLSTADERALNDWWTNEHLPERLAIPGFRRTRRYYHTSKDSSDETTASRSHSQAHGHSYSHYLVVYEVSSLSTLTSPAYMHALNNPTVGTQKFMPVLASMNRSACTVLSSVSRPEFSQCQRGGVGGTLAHVLFEAPGSSEAREGLRTYLATEAWELILSFFPSVLAMHLLEHDEEASRSGNSTRSYDNVKFQAAAAVAGGGGGADEQHRTWMLLVEFSDPFEAPFASYKEKCPGFSEGLGARGVDLSTLKEEIYGLVVAMEE